MLLLTRIGIGAAVLAVATHAHTWIDCLDTDMLKIYEHSQQSIHSKSGWCGGYIFDFQGHTDAHTQKLLKDDIKGGAKLCKDEPKYSDWRNRLKVKAGQKFYFGYLENGHITKDHAGIKSYYGTYWSGSTDKSLETSADIKPENLVDGTYYDYDDATCGEQKWLEGKNENGENQFRDSDRAGEGVPCIGEASLPAGTKPGIYSLVWYWEFFQGDVEPICTLPGLCSGGAAYTSCYQVEVVADDAQLPPPAQLPPRQPADLKQRQPRPPTKPANGNTADTPAPPAPSVSESAPAPAPSPEPAPAPAPAETEPAPGTVTPPGDLDGAEDEDEGDIEYVVVKKRKNRKNNRKKAKTRLIKKLLKKVVAAEEEGDDDAVDEILAKLDILTDSRRRKRALRHHPQ